MEPTGSARHLARRPRARHEPFHAARAAAAVARPDRARRDAGRNRQGVRLRVFGARRRLIRDAGVLWLADGPQPAARRVLHDLRLYAARDVYRIAAAGPQVSRHSAYLI